MAATAMMLRFVPKPDELKVRAMYRNFCNLVEKATMEQKKIDRQGLTGTNSYHANTTSSWSKGHIPPSP
jgi:hypothetical protein